MWLSRLKAGFQRLHFIEILNMSLLSFFLLHRMVRGKTKQDPTCPECSHNFFRLVFAPTGAFSKSRPILPCRISAWNGIYRLSLCWLVTYLGLCATRDGSKIRRAFGNRVELTILLGQLLGNRSATALPRRSRNVTPQEKWRL